MLAMGILLAILVITFILIIGAGFAFFRMFGEKQTGTQHKPDMTAGTSEKTRRKGFRWSFVILPAVGLVLTLGSVIYFYGKLPDEVAYRFDSAGSPAGWLSRSQMLLWALIPQLLLTLLAIVIAVGARGISSLFQQAEAAGIKLDTILLIMSNMVVIPQLLLLFAILNIFSYNSFQTRISFVWGLAITIIVVGLVVLGFFFIRAIRKAGSVSK